MVLETDSFFDANPGVGNFNLEALITNGIGETGSSIYYFIVNKPPDAPYHDPLLVPQPALLPNHECQVKKNIYCSEMNYVYFTLCEVSSFLNSKQDQSHYTSNDMMLLMVSS